MHNVGDEATEHPAVQHLDALTSLRFFAALYVLMFHYTSISGRRWWDLSPAATYSNGGR